MEINLTQLQALTEIRASSGPKTQLLVKAVREIGNEADVKRYFKSISDDSIEAVIKAHQAGATSGHWDYIASAAQHAKLDSKLADLANDLMKLRKNSPVHDPIVEELAQLVIPLLSKMGEAADHFKRMDDVRQVLHSLSREANSNTDSFKRTVALQVLKKIGFVPRENP